MNQQLRRLYKHDLNVLTAFLMHFLIYFLAMSLIWLGWLAEGGDLDFYAWPVYPSFAWGLLLITHFIIVYRTLRSKKREHNQAKTGKRSLL